jgi:hypothetical protein
MKSQLRRAAYGARSSESTSTRPRGSGYTGRRDHDTRTIEHLVEIMPRSSVLFLTEHHFAASWKRRLVLPSTSSPSNSTTRGTGFSMRSSTPCGHADSGCRDFADTFGQESAPRCRSD